MLEGVIVKNLLKHCDDRGYFMEIVREDDGLLDHFAQVSLSMTYPGVIKAFHYHQQQDDLWFFPTGSVQVVLYDLRRDSPTHNQQDVFFMGENNPVILLIPHGVAHGYRVLGQKPATIMYCTNNTYKREQPDECRIPWDDPGIGFDWKTKNR